MKEIKKSDIDSFKIYKGYGRLDHLEDENEDNNKSHLPSSKKPISIAITFTFLLIFMIFALIHHYHTKPHQEYQLGSSSSFNSATRSIQLVCNVTQYPDSCFSTLTSINTKSNPDPEFLFSLSLHASIDELSKLGSLPWQLSSGVNDSRTRSALEDCQSLFSDALYRLNQSESVPKGHVASSSGVKISDIKTWISAAMTDQETCLDGLEEVESTVVDEVKTKVHDSTVCMSNSLAILANIKGLLEKFHRPVSGGHLSNNDHI